MKLHCGINKLHSKVNQRTPLLCREHFNVPQTQVSKAFPQKHNLTKKLNSRRITLLNTVALRPALEAVTHETAKSNGSSTVSKKSTLRNIVFVTAEVSPWSKTGGLADVASSLPIALAARGHRVMVVAPRYDNYKEAPEAKKKLEVLGVEINYHHYQSRGVDWVFVDHISYHRPGGLYADEFGVYGDNQFRFTLLCLAALEAPLHLDFEEGPYGQDIMWVANDWHAALVPVYLAAKYRPHGVYTGSRSLLAIHNLRHQGVFPPSTFEQLGLPPNWYNTVEWQYPPNERKGSYAEEGRSVNHMKAGIICADRVMTVSPGYADEIVTYLGGWGMESLLSQRAPVLNGIVNGIDTNEWDPSSDPFLTHHYDVTNFKEVKAKIKEEVQKELGLPVGNKPLFAFVGRLDFQKGADILLAAAPQLLDRYDVQLVCLGSGEKPLEDGLRWLENEYNRKARGWVGFNVPFSHRLFAAADFVIVPSRFEPCGLIQLYAMRYGAVPIAHKTGGLKDTVTNFDPWAQKGTGWTYTQCDAEGLMTTLNIALRTYYDHHEDFMKLQRRGMERESSWDHAASEYEQIFDWAAFDEPYCK